MINYSDTVNHIWNNEQHSGAYIRVAWKGLDKTRAPHKSTAKRAPNMPMHHRHVSMHIDMVFIVLPVQINPLPAAQWPTSNKMKQDR